jgi:hypothetical protein
MADQFDSRPDTYEHIRLVAKLVNGCIRDLLTRTEKHDQSKLVEPELTAFNELVPNLANCEYGSPEYHAALKKHRPAVVHHYTVNCHHPEHYVNGIAEMDLLDLLEMACDWEAAARRKGGHAFDSLDTQQERFGFSDELKSILGYTLRVIERTK